MRKIVPAALLVASIAAGCFHVVASADEIACKCCTECLKAQKGKKSEEGKGGPAGGCQECCRRCGLNMAFSNSSSAAR